MNNKIFGTVQQVLSENANINIIVPVVIDIHDTYAGTPDIGMESGFFRYIFKFIIPFIDIEAAADLVAGKKISFFPSLLKSPMPTPPPI